MDRQQFTTEFRRAFRFVVQKLERAAEARRQVAELRKDNPYWEFREHDAVAEAENNVDAAVDQLADHLYDSLEAAWLVARTSATAATAGPNGSPDHPARSTEPVVQTHPSVISPFTGAESGERES